MKVDYRLGIRIRIKDIYDLNLDEDVELNLDASLNDDLETIVEAIATVDKELSEKFYNEAGCYDCQASDILTVCDYNKEELEYDDEFFDGAIYVYLPIHIDIEGLRKLLKM